MSREALLLMIDSGSAPLAPTGVTLNNHTGSLMRVTFTPSLGATSYVVEGDKDDEELWDVVASGGGSPIDFNPSFFLGAVNGNKVEVRIYASNAFGTSPASAIDDEIYNG